MSRLTKIIYGREQDSIPIISGKKKKKSYLLYHSFIFLKLSVNKSWHAFCEHGSLSSQNATHNHHLTILLTAARHPSPLSSLQEAFPNLNVG